MPLNNFVPKFNACLPKNGFAAEPKPKKLLLAEATPKGAAIPAAKGPSSINPLVVSQVLAVGLLL